MAKEKDKTKPTPAPATSDPENASAPIDTMFQTSSDNAPAVDADELITLIEPHTEVAQAAFNPYAGGLPVTATDEAEDVAKELERTDLDERRPLCEPSLRKGLKKLAQFEVLRHNGVTEKCCKEEVGPANTYVRMKEITLQ